MIREFIRALLSEEAVSLSQASASGLCLLKHTLSGVFEHGEMILILYDPTIVTKDLDHAQTITTESIVGYMMVHVGDQDENTPCWNAKEVKEVAANKGYGPLMYDIAMSEIDGPLMADRHVVKPQARRIWNNFKNNRSDVKVLPLDDFANPKTPEVCDDCIVHNEKGDAVNAAYERKSRLNVVPILSNHQMFMKKMIDEWEIDEAKFERLLDIAGNKYFIDRYIQSPNN